MSESLGTVGRYCSLYELSKVLLLNTLINTEIPKTTANQFLIHDLAQHKLDMILKW